MIKHTSCSLTNLYLLSDKEQMAMNLIFPYNSYPHSSALEQLLHTTVLIYINLTQVDTLGFIKKKTVFCPHFSKWITYPELVAWVSSGRILRLRRTISCAITSSSAVSCIRCSVWASCVQSSLLSPAYPTTMSSYQEPRTWPRKQVNS